MVATQKLLKMLLLKWIRSTPSLLAQGVSGMLLTERMGNQVEPHLRSVNRHLAVQAAMLIAMVATGDLVAVLLDLVLMIAEQLAVWTDPMVVLLIQCPVVKAGYHHKRIWRRERQTICLWRQWIREPSHGERCEFREWWPRQRLWRKQRWCWRFWYRNHPQCKGGCIMISGTVNSEGNLFIKSSHTTGYNWFAGSGGRGDCSRLVRFQPRHWWIL